MMSISKLILSKYIEPAPMDENPSEKRLDTL